MDYTYGCKPQKGDKMKRKNRVNVRVSTAKTPPHTFKLLTLPLCKE